MHRVVAVASLLVAVTLAGCAARSPAQPLADAASPSSTEVGTWTLELSGCEEGGFVALYDLDRNNPSGVGEGYTRADVTEEVGNPAFISMRPRTSGATGNWHEGFRCESGRVGDVATMDFMFGYVGVWAEAPEWDVGGADEHVVLAGFGFEPGPVRDSLMAATMADITETINSETVWYAPRAAGLAGAAYTEYNDVQKGHYYSYGEVHKIRDVDARTIRFWWAVPTDGSRAEIGGHGHEDAAGQLQPPHEHAAGFHPIYFDLTTSGGGQWAAEGSDALSCHGGTQEHGPQGFLCQPTTTLVYDHSSAVLNYGGVLDDVVVEEVWMH